MSDRVSDFAERLRLQALERYDVLDTPPEEAFDRVTRLACRVFDAPMAAIVFIDERRDWYKSRQGIGVTELPRGPNFCDVAMQEATALIVPNADLDPRFRSHPAVAGHPNIRAYAGVPLRTPDGQSLGTVCVMDTRPREFVQEDVASLSDMAGLVATVLDLRLHALTDGLTGALSRRGFRQRAEAALDRTLRRTSDLGCLMIDLDHFKAVNDGHGHAAGDTILMRTVEACRAALPDDALVGRMGGEEFAVVLPDCAAPRAMEHAETLRVAISGLRVMGVGGPIAVSASVGVASLNRPGEGLDALLARADAALYRAKQDGRDRCRAWTPQTGLRSGPRPALPDCAA